MSKTEVTFPSSDPSCQLCGDLTFPLTPPPPRVDGPARLLPAIVIVAGSGPIDRNGNAPGLRMSFNTSNRFAERMTSRERPPERVVAVLSYDKRGVAKSSDPKDRNFYYRAGMMDLALDAVEAARYAGRHPRIDKTKIILLGHSEGAIILPLICREVGNAGLDPIAGCIFYSGFGENLVDAMALQRETLLREVGQMSGPMGWFLRRLVTREKLVRQYEELMKKINSPDEPDFVSMQCGMTKQPAKWLREHIAYDVRAALDEHITCHCLAITGQKDFQVRNAFCDQEVAAGLVPRAKSIEAHRPLNLTHVLRSMDGPPKMMNMKKDYAKMSQLPLDEEIMSITSAWCDRVLFSNEQ